MKLSVPELLQEKDSTNCQAVCVQMILHYYGDMVSIEEIMEGLQPYMIDGSGMHSEGPPIWLRERGYDVIYVVHDSDVIDSSIANATEKDAERLRAKLDKIVKRADKRDDYRIEKLALYLKVIESGAKFSNEIAKLSLLDGLLEQKIPIKLGVRANAMRLDPWLKGGHSVVVVGKEGDDYIVNDPSPYSRQHYSVNSDQLQTAWSMGGTRVTIVKKPSLES